MQKIQDDLDAGQTRSRVETKKLELVDLTKEMETPTRPRGLSLGDSSNKPSVVTNLARELGVADNKDVAGQPGAEVDDSLCPVCGKRFKNSKGVLRHRSAKNSSCKPEKNPLRSSDDDTPASHIAK